MEDLKNWIDAELSAIQIILFLILANVVDGWIKYVFVLFAILSFVYMIKKTLKLPKDYLK